LSEIASQVLAAFKAKGKMLATAESCTGGMVVAALTDIAGSSAVVERGFVTYSNSAKVELLGVDPALIEAKGAVSSEVALAMVLGALAHSHADVAVSVTGIAGPDGGSPEKPVGTVWFGCSTKAGGAGTFHYHFRGDRAAIRQQATETGLALLLQWLPSFE
jgi:nicotinamide-nucleotide amidase